MSSTQLLSDLALVYTTETCPIITDSERDEIESLVTPFLAGELGHLDAAEIYLDKFGTRAPIDRLKDILDVEDTPLPVLPDHSDFGPRRKTQQWTQVEDNRLLADIYKYGTENWNTVARFVGSSRTRSQCSQRWQRVLNPRISRTPWTREEEKVLCQLVEKHGEKSWIRVSAEIGHRSDVQCRYRYRQICKRIMLSDVKECADKKRAVPPPPDHEIQTVVNVDPGQAEKTEGPPWHEIVPIEWMGLELGARSMSEIFWMLHP
jgi:hypothetical protein